MSGPSISIIIPNRNSGFLLRRCLRSLQKQRTKESFEVIVVDDGSTDGSARCVGDSPGVKLIRQEHKGTSSARNWGLQAARGKVILFLDSDCAAGPNWVREISTQLGREGVLVTMGRFTSSQPGLIPCLVQQELEGRFQRMHTHGDVDFLNSATCGFVRRVIEQYRFDPELDKLEDIDLSFRLAADGIRIRYTPTAIVNHHHPESLWACLLRKFRYGRAAPVIYRRFPGKSLGDTSTPPHRRLQLGLVLLGMAALPFSSLLGAAIGLISLVLTFPAAARAWPASRLQAMLYPVFSLAGSMVLLLGWTVGTVELLMGRRPARQKFSSGANE